jgi:hypothetical protein
MTTPGLTTNLSTRFPSIPAVSKRRLAEVDEEPAHKGTHGGRNPAEQLREIPQSKA